ncbi:uncharacterized protein LOC110733727 [Chenopodium quinoa]|uniref:uncharacterized protein LOC110733727 n=1 Tax=Chenopodium quinoa TaxID=63459 RepID=UPI000B78F81A|nr:uncharacterized protein LOC110733727 [Chenopodium quinoa]
MADEGQHQDEDKLNADLFHALSHDDDEQVIKLCNEIEGGPLYNMTLHQSTVLHMACFLKKLKLADRLLDIVFANASSDELYQKLSEPKNAWGNTVIHDAATSNKGIPFVEKLLNKVPVLINVKNKWGESPLIQAIRYGRKRMYKCLVNQVKYCESQGLTKNERLVFLKRKDNMTILHMAILTRKFDVALDIAKRYPELYDEKDSHKMTALQMLAHSPTAFKSGTILGPLQKLVYSFVSTDEQDATAEVGMTGKDSNFIFGRRCCKFAMIEEVREKKGNQDALQLAKMLIKSDKSWKNTYFPLAETTPNIGKKKTALRHVNFIVNCNSVD